MADIAYPVDEGDLSYPLEEYAVEAEQTDSYPAIAPYPSEAMEGKSSQAATSAIQPPKKRVKVDKELVAFMPSRLQKTKKR